MFLHGPPHGQETKAQKIGNQFFALFFCNFPGYVLNPILIKNAPYCERNFAGTPIK